MLEVQNQNGVYTLTMTRPEVHNAFNDELIAEMTKTLSELSKTTDLRLLVLTGSGRSFCAGADINWMKRMKDYSLEENIEDSRRMGMMFEALNTFNRPLLGKINGHALGGGLGLVSCCDFALGVEDAKFGFTEAKLGILPAVISPYVMAKIGESHARAYFLSGARFKADLALRMNLLHGVTTRDDLDAEMDKVISEFLSAGPVAGGEAKTLVSGVLARSGEEQREWTYEKIAKIRISEEGQEGMAALLEKRKPNWVNE